MSAAQFLIYISRSVSRPDLIFAIGPNRARLLFARPKFNFSLATEWRQNEQQKLICVYMRLGAKFYRRSDWN